MNRHFKNEADASMFVNQLESIVSEHAKDEAKLATSKDEFNLGMASIRKEISESKIDLIKWMFGFWVALVLLILIAFFIKK